MVRTCPVLIWALLLALIMGCADSVPTPGAQEQMTMKRLETARDELRQVKQALLDNVSRSDVSLDEMLQL